MIDTNQELVLFWHRRDLRLTDNHGLFQALSQHQQVLPLFIFDQHILEKLTNKADARIGFIHEQLQAVKAQYQQHGGSLLVQQGSPQQVFNQLVEQYRIKAVYTNHDYEPYATMRDAAIADLLQHRQIPFYTYKDQVVFEKSEVVKDDGAPYTVFTPYMKKWKKAISTEVLTSFPSEQHLDNLLQVAPLPMPTLADIGFEPCGIAFPEGAADEAIIKNYHLDRDLPAKNGTTRLSVHMRFGTVSIRRLTRLAYNTNEKWLNELIWRNFYMAILWHFPHVVNKAFKPAYDLIPWRNNEAEFELWKQGKTGYPIVDAGMRELNATGFMHNRVRMITASFLVKHLLIDWRWGEAYFAEKLLDFELASNNGGWQWAASSGCDAAPYFRVFNPELQTKKFDPQLKYVKHWVPEFQEFGYPPPMVNHAFARQRVLDTYKTALNQS